MNKILELSKSENWIKYRNILDKFCGKKSNNILTAREFDKVILFELIELGHLKIELKKPLIGVSDEDVIKWGNLYLSDYRKYRIFEELGDKYPITFNGDYISIDDISDEIIKDIPLEECLEGVRNWYDFANDFEREFKVIPLRDYNEIRKKTNLKNKMISIPLNDIRDCTSKYCIFKIEYKIENAPEKLTKFFNSVTYGKKVFTSEETKEGIYVFYSTSFYDEDTEYILENINKSIDEKNKKIKILKNVISKFD